MSITKGLHDQPPRPNIANRLKSRHGPTEHSRDRRHPRCTRDKHTFTCDAANDLLAPCLDLIPGRRCICGLYVILDEPAPAHPSDIFRIARIDSSAAAKFVFDNPALKTW